MGENIEKSFRSFGELKDYWDNREEDKEKPMADQEETETRKTVEQGLSPEVIESVMEKVQDIDANGTAYHLLSISSAVSQSEGRNEKLSEVLKHGLLGTY